MPKEGKKRKAAWQKSQSLADRRSVRAKISSIRNSVAGNAKDVTDDSVKAKEILGTLNQVFETDVRHAREAVMDASALASLSSCGVEAARKLGREKSFQMNDVLRQLEVSYSDSDGAIDWADLGKEVSVFFRRIPNLDMMNGTWKSAKIRKKRATKVREVRKSREMAIQPTQTHSTQVEKDDDDKEGATVQDIMDTISTLQQEHAPQGKPINALKFLVNPKSFSQTIENIFFVAFGTKQGNIKIGVNHEGAPYLSDYVAKPDGKAKDPKQFVFSLDFETWKRMSQGKYPHVDPKNSVLPNRATK